MKALLRLILLLVLAGCTAANEEALPTMVEFPSQTPSTEAQTISQTSTESPTESSIASPTSFESTATQAAPTATATSTATIPAIGIWLTLQGSKAYECASLECEVILELPPNLRFIPIERTEEWHTVRMDATTLVYIPVATTRQLSEAEINATATPTSSPMPSATVSISLNPTAANSANVPPPSGSGNNPPPVFGGNNPPPVGPSPTAVVINTLIPTHTQNPNPDLTNVPPAIATATLAGANDVPFMPSLTPSNTPPPPPIIVLPPAN